MLNPKRILLVSAHPDDAVIGAGGTIARFKRENPDCVVWSIYFVPCTEDPRNCNVPQEYKACSKVLGIDRDIEYKMPRDGYLENHKQKVRDILWKLRNLFKPDLVLCPSTHDFHQDHKGLAECCQTIFRDTSTIFAYEVMRSVMPTFQPTLYIMLQEEDTSKKWNAIAQYKSQFEIRGNVFNVECIKANLILRGSQANTTWAECFEVLWGRL